MDNPLARGFHHGDLDFKGKEKEEILRLLETVPTIVDIYLDCPAVLLEINAKPKGKLLFELPASMEAVCNQKEGLPRDSGRHLYPFGFGLSC